MIISDIKIGKSIEMCFIHNNPKVDHFINDYNNKDKYLKEQCAYKCRYFVLKKVKNT